MEDAAWFEDSESNNRYRMFRIRCKISGRDSQEGTWILTTICCGALRASTAVRSICAFFAIVCGDAGGEPGSNLFFPTHLQV